MGTPRRSVARRRPGAHAGGPALVFDKFGRHVGGGSECALRRRLSATVFTTAGVFPVFASSFVRVPLRGRTLVFYGLLVAWGAAAWQVVPAPAIVRRAASIPATAEGLEGFVNAADALITPALVAMAAVTPLGCVVGAMMLMFGSRRGMVMVGSSLGTLVFLGSVKGIVA